MKVYIKLFAGLGNQIFQYIYGRYLEQQGIRVKYLMARLKAEPAVHIDFPDVFFLSEKEKKKLFIADNALSSCVLILKKIYAKYICHSYETGFYQDVRIVNEVSNRLGINTILHFKRENQYASSELFRLIDQKQNSISIHIRGGDYLGNGSPFSDVCTADYYARAMDYMMKNTVNPYFFVFTNDRKFSDSLLSKIKLPQNKFSYVTDSPDFALDSGYDMFLMSHCHHNIIANSTYSWWAAYLNQKQDKVVITPPVWTKDNSQLLEQMKPASWVAL